MGFFEPKAGAAEVAAAVSRLTGENLALSAVVALLLRHSPERDTVLQDLSMASGVLSSSARDRHPLVRMGIEETLEAVRRMA